ncbi:methyltransferase-like protein 25B [Branchiostoma lanceolatum]|uniref:methyltransferase-like protein 25B n=1 Tax=Branchiostoma lanceolatum TaxID=7740 RepID=UPI0034563514
MYKNIVSSDLMASLGDFSCFSANYKDIGTGNYVERICRVLAEHEWIYNFQLTRFFVEKVWEKLPKEWREPLLSLSTDDLNHLPAGRVKDDWPTSLKDFVETAASLALPRQQSHDLVAMEINKDLARGMTPKKKHEVSYLASVVRDTCRKTSCSTVIDIGSGLGYLGQVLHHQCGLQVVGVEAQASHVHGAQRRIKSQGKDADTQIQTVNLKLEDTSSCIHDLELLISSLQQSPSKDQNQTDVINRNNDLEREDGTCMVGLHCCGDLCPTMLKMFVSVERLKCLVCVSCCYHGMSVTDPDSRPSCFMNFPLSRTVKEKLKKVGRDFPDWQLNVFAMRLAAQETQARWACQTHEDHQFHTRSVAYRAILEHVVTTGKWYVCFRSSILDIQCLACFVINVVFLFVSGGKGIQKLKRKVTRKDAFQSFPMYLEAVFGRLTLHSDETVQTEEDWKKYHDALQQSHDQWEGFFPYIEVITALQVLLQPVLETLVSVDRCLYLQEQGLKTKVVPIFDDRISPRNLAIIAER